MEQDAVAEAGREDQVVAVPEAVEAGARAEEWAQGAEQELASRSDGAVETAPALVQPREADGGRDPAQDLGLAEEWALAPERELDPETVEEPALHLAQEWAGEEHPAEDWASQRTRIFTRSCTH